MTPDKFKELLAKPSVKARNIDIARELLGWGDELEPEIHKKRIRQNADPMNQTEKRAMAWLQKKYPLYTFRFQPITMELANGCKYTPDLCAVHNEFCLGALQFWEIKGPHAWEDSIVKLKVAARMWPQFIFHLIWEVGDRWSEQRIYP